VVRVEIDLNVRVRGNWTFTGLEDADGPIAVGDVVQVFEPESGIEGPGRVEEVDLHRRLIFLSVDWASLDEPVGQTAMSFDQMAAFGIIASLTSRPGIGASAQRQPAIRVEAVSAVACSA